MHRRRTHQSHSAHPHCADASLVPSAVPASSSPNSPDERMPRSKRNPRTAVDQLRAGQAPQSHGDKGVGGSRPAICVRTSPSHHPHQTIGAQLPIPTAPAPVLSPIVTHPAPMKAASCSNSRGRSPRVTFATRLPRGPAEQQSSRLVGLERCRHRPQSQIIERHGAPTRLKPGHTQRNSRTSIGHPSGSSHSDPHPGPGTSPAPRGMRPIRDQRLSTNKAGSNHTTVNHPRRSRPPHSGPPAPLGTLPGCTSTRDSPRQPNPAVCARGRRIGERVAGTTRGALG